MKIINITSTNQCILCTLVGVVESAVWLVCIVFVDIEAEI